VRKKKVPIFTLPFIPQRLTLQHSATHPAIPFHVHVVPFPGDMPSKTNAPSKRKHKGVAVKPENPKKRKREDEDFDKLVQDVEELVSYLVLLENLV
jgi:hypothetical protein